MMMSRQSRQILIELDKYAKESDVQGLTIPAHIYLADILTAKFYNGAILAVIKSKMATIPKVKRRSNHFTIDYWYKMVTTMLGAQQAPQREQLGTIYENKLEDWNAFNHIISQYLLTDYSTAESMLINNIVNEYSQMDIVKACNVGKANNVFSIQYVKVVLESERAKQRLAEHKIDILGDKIDQSNRLLDVDKIVHTPLEVVQAAQTFEEKRNNILLQLMLDKLGGEKK